MKYLVRRLTVQQCLTFPIQRVSTDLVLYGYSLYLHTCYKYGLM